MGDAPPDAGMPTVPADADGPVFREPWQAQAFAIVVRLQAAGYFTWAEWTACLAAEIKAAQRGGDPDLGDTYYRHWLAALERLVIDKRLALPAELRVRRIELEARPSAAHAHPARRTPVAVG